MLYICLLISQKINEQIYIRGDFSMYKSGIIFILFYSASSAASDIEGGPRFSLTVVDEGTSHRRRMVPHEPAAARIPHSAGHLPGMLLNDKGVPILLLLSYKLIVIAFSNLN